MPQFGTDEIIQEKGRDAFESLSEFLFEKRRIEGRLTNVVVSKRSLCQDPAQRHRSQVLQ
jgi:hypothetical protein